MDQKLKLGDIVQTSQTGKPSAWIGLGVVRSFDSVGVNVEMLEGRNKGVTGGFYCSQVTPVTSSEVKNTMLGHLYAT